VKLTIILLAAFLVGCVPPKATRAPDASTDFSAFRTVSYVVRVVPSTEYSSGDPEYATVTLDGLRRQLGERLEMLSYKVVPENGELAIDVLVKAVKPGSATARFLIGFGAGRASLTFNATYTDATGKVLGAFAGGSIAYTQMAETKDDIRHALVADCAFQLTDFMRKDSEIH